GSVVLALLLSLAACRDGARADPPGTEAPIDVPALRTRSFGEGPATLVLLHGYGAPGDDLVPLARRLAAPGWRAVLPEAPLAIPSSRGRAWWPLGDVRARRAAGEDLTITAPRGLDARARVLGLLGRLEAEGAGPVVLGGFSQGAMLAMDVAFTSERPLAGLIAWSGTVMRRARWEAGLLRRRALPSLLSHGTGDPLLAHDVSAAWARTLEGAGLDVRWVSFPGGHAIPAPARAAAATLLREVLSSARPAGPADPSGSARGPGPGGR
ncbi:MAG: hypothetical protein AAGH15_26695, partial [Myxococcota bacterium]